jgi:hypothetical protein
MTASTMETVRYPLRPTPAPIKGTLLDAADYREQSTKWLVTRDHHTEELFDSYNCMKFQHVAEKCSQTEKDFDQPKLWQSGFEFAVYGGTTCGSVGLDFAEMEAEVTRVFHAGETTAVAQALMATRFAEGPDRDAGVGEDLAWEAPEDISGASAVKPLVGLAQLESFAAANYVGVPTMHMPRSIATLLFGVGALEWDGPVLRTKLGSKVAADPGYDYPNTSPVGAAAATGEKWLYATGEVVVIADRPIIKQMMAHTTNDVFVLGERAYVAAVDCFTAAVKVTETT